MAESSPNDAGETPDRVWEQGWEGHQQRQMERLAQLSLAEKLDWLEQAHRLVLQMSGKTRPGS